MRKKPSATIKATPPTSTDSTHSRVASMLSLGAKGYIKKPFSPEILREEIERVMEVVQ